MGKVLKIGAFITSHGFGHGTRTCAVLNEIAKFRSCKFEIFSTLPNWFFSHNLPELELELHNIQTDVGLAQKSPFIHDLKETLKQLEKFTQFNNRDFLECLKIVKNNDFDLLISDISPVGLEIGKQMDIPSALIENFTWDWIYQEYCDSHFGFNRINEILEKSYSYADLHIQASPFCQKKNRTIETPPISRSIRKPHSEIKQLLGIGDDAKVILLTTGGITKKLNLIESLKEESDLIFITTTTTRSITTNQNIISIPLQSDIHYPDLVNASNLVVGKVGYGTLAECWSTDTPLLGCYRNDFRESNTLDNFASKNLSHAKISVEDFEGMNWIPKAREIMIENTTSKSSPDTTGASIAAEEVIRFIT